MNRNALHIISLLIMLSFTWFSCSNEDKMIFTENEGLTLHFSLAGTITRAAEDGEDVRNENTIQTVDVFIYQENGENCIHYEHFDISPATSGTEVYKKGLNTTQEAFTLNTKYNIYVVANYTGNIPANGLSFSELKALSVSGLESDKLQESFLMDGHHTMILNDGVIKNKNIPVSLKRAAAKIRISVKYSNGFSPMPFSTIAKRVANYATVSAVIENGDSINPELKSMPTLTAQETGAGDANNIIVYSYANNWNMDANNETYLIISAPVVDSNNTFYPSNFYKIPVSYNIPSNNDGSGSTSEEEQKTLRKLLRNHLYDITVNIDQLGGTLPERADTLTASYTIAEWTDREIPVEVDGVNFLYVKDTHITLPTDTTYTTTFQSSTPHVEISDITVNDESIDNGEQGVNILWTANAKSGNITINTSLPTNFISKEISFVVSNGVGQSVTVVVSQYPSVYLSYDISADVPGGSQGQNNNKIYIMNSLTADFSTLQNPDEFDEDFGEGYYHYAPNPELGASYADYIRNDAVLGYPIIDSSGAAIDSDENNRRISPRFMLASQHGTTTAANYTISRQKCIDYVENDETTGERYSDWRMPTLAEIYMIDILQNIRASYVKKILEGNYYWSSQRSSAVLFMDPRVGSFAQFTPAFASVRCVRDVK